MAEVSAAVLAAAAFPEHSAPLAGGVALPPGSIVFANASGALAGVAGFAWDSTNLTLKNDQGTNVSVYNTYIGRRLHITDGTVASPVTTPGSTARFTQVAGQSFANTVDTAASSTLVAVQTDGGGSGTQQTTALYGEAWSYGTGAHDTIAGTFVARGSGTGVGGVGSCYFEARSESASRGVINAEFQTQNNSGAPGVFNATHAASTMVGLWLTISSNQTGGLGNGAAAIEAAGLHIGQGTQAQWLNGFVAKQDAIVDNAFRDESNATTSHLINGSHTYGVDTKGGTFSGAPIRLGNAQNIAGRNAANSADLPIIGVNAANQIALGGQVAAGLFGGASAHAATVEINAPASTVALNVKGSGGNAFIVRNSSDAAVLIVADASLSFNRAAAFVGTSGENAQIQFIEEQITLSTSGTTTDSVANLLPANAEILAVTARVTTAITTATNWAVGDATTPARFISANSTLTANATAVGLNHKNGAAAGAASAQLAAAKVRITTTGTPGAGVIRIAVAYILHAAPTV